MRKVMGFFSLLVVLSLLLTACGPAATPPPATPTSPPAATPTPAPTPEKVIKVGQVTDVGGIDDRSFNQTAWLGVQQAIDELGIEGRYLESQSAADYEPNINTFLSEGYDMIITVGFMIMDATFAAANANPDTDFVWVDGFSDPAVTNLAAVVTATDGPAFLAGYLAAGVTQTGKVGTYGGIQIPTVEIFMVGFEHGVEYYNEQHGTSVEVLGWNSETRTGTFTGDFENTDNGRRVTESFLDEEADIILPVAGPVGLGTAAVCLERGCMMIGVDADMYYTAPDYASVMLTSIMKNMNVAIFQAIQGEVNGTFQGGSDILLTLANDGAQLAPLHDFDSQVPQSLKDELEQLKQGLIDGTISTGWPLPE